MIKTKYGDCWFDKSTGYWVLKDKRYLHRVVYEDYYGVELTSNDIIHHKDGRKTNNNISNLERMTRAEHNKTHFSKFEYTIIKEGFSKGKQMYGLCYNGKRIKRSIYKDKLLKLCEELNNGLEVET